MSTSDRNVNYFFTIVVPGVSAVLMYRVVTGVGAKLDIESELFYTIVYLASLILFYFLSAHFAVVGGSNWIDTLYIASIVFFSSMLFLRILFCIADNIITSPGPPLFSLDFLIGAVKYILTPYVGRVEMLLLPLFQVWVFSTMDDRLQYAYHETVHHANGSTSYAYVRGSNWGWPLLLIGIVQAVIYRPVASLLGL